MVNVEEKEIAQKFAPLREVKLSNEDKSDILAHLREEMLSTREARRCNVNPKKRTKYWARSTLRVGFAAAAGIAIIAGAALTLHGGKTDIQPSPGVITEAYAYTIVAPPVFNSIQMTDVHSGWGRGYSKSGLFELIHSTDGGVHWSRIHLPKQPPIYDISTNQMGQPGYVQSDFLNGSVGWLGWVNHHQLTVLSTQDGGLHWRTAQTPVSLYAQTVTNIDFVSPTSGWILTGSAPGMGQEQKFLYKTTDSGNTWAKVADSSSSLPRLGIQTMIGFQNNLDGWFASGNPASPYVNLWNTNDGGRSWREVDAPIPAGFETADAITATTPSFSGQRGVFTVTYYKLVGGASHDFLVVYRTDNDGQTWRPMPVRIASDMSLNVSLNPQYLWSVKGREVFGSTNGGAEWSRLATLTSALTNGYPNITQMSFVNPHVGWMLIVSADFTKSKLLKTTDGGYTWRSQS